MSGIAILLAPLFVIVPVAVASFGFLAIASKKWWLQEGNGGQKPLLSFIQEDRIEVCGSCEGTCVFYALWYIYKCEVDMQIARTTTHCKIAKCALKKLPTANL